MKINVPVTQNGVTFSDEDFLVSTTDLKGIITYANDIFIHVSGYSRAELIGKNHNIIRHPDMPPAAFANLWQTLKKGESWRNIVKNRSKNGDYYWVDAYVSPLYKEKEVIGYQSVRTRPSDVQIAAAERLYRQLNENPDAVIPHKRHFRNLSALMLINIGMISLMLFQIFNFILLLRGADNLSTMRVVIGFIGVLWPLPMYYVMRSLFAPIHRTAQWLQNMTSGVLRERIDVLGRNEVGMIAESTKSLQARLITMIGEFTESSVTLSSVADKLSASSEHSVQGLEQQTRQTEMVASAMHEMTATVQDVARNASQTAEAVQQAQKQTAEGRQELQRTHVAINQLASRLDSTAKAIDSLRAKGDAIEKVVKLISGIADQTNLLALNAAIEAARAGEHGRGFAVVADEVRSLAAKTQSSTIEIRDMIKQLRGGIVEAVDAVQQGHSQMEQVKERATATEQSLGSINSAVQHIGDMSTQIAAATEEQSMVAEEMNGNIIEISNQTEVATRLSRDNAVLGVQIAELSVDLNRIVSAYNLGMNDTGSSARRKVGRKIAEEQGGLLAVPRSQRTIASHRATKNPRDAG
ncbi:MAG: PAS domain-containing methyl-accepting chemotaxis protein [Halothiobacillus sp.]|uniref:methyl-accepting chemotaxis protein n=1 Tax=Halothiobacillus sp. TaxID=1891311 RepID=UPI002AD587F1|nr:PAS domain-containing methyl-accepting chemotaxis protein [Halothiobacillus sp.]MDA3878485.1 PAS domain-containing methyl-accepting chemotaxis protein [Halothiobacillus sp.]